MPELTGQKDEPQLRNHIGREYEDINFQELPCSPSSHEGPISPVVVFQDGGERLINICATCGQKIESKPYEDAIGFTIEGVGRTLKRFRKTTVGEHELDVQLPIDTLDDAVAENGGNPGNYTVTSAGVGDEALEFSVVSGNVAEELPTPVRQNEGESVQPHYTYKDGAGLVVLLDGERMDHYEDTEGGFQVFDSNFRDDEVLFVSVSIIGGPSLSAEHLDSGMTGEKEIRIDLTVEQEDEDSTVYTPNDDRYDFELELIRMEEA